MPAHYMQWVAPEAYPIPLDPSANLDDAAREACRMYVGHGDKAQRSRDVDHMWQVITKGAHHMHTNLAGMPVSCGDQRKPAKAVQREEYGPGPHRDGIPESVAMRRPTPTSSLSNAQLARPGTSRDGA